MSIRVFPARIVTDPEILGGKPTISGTRLSVAYILGLLSHGATEQEILDEYNGLTHEDIAACLEFAGQAVDRPMLASARA